MRHTVSAAALALLALSLGACGESSSTGSSASASAPPPTAWLLTSEPAGAVPVTKAKAGSEEGALVVIAGRIGGRKDPLSAESPVFTIVDLALPHCGELEGDGCKTPWDYCCETPEDMRANSATVQIVDADGRALDINPVASGLEPLDEVVIVGAVGPRPSEDVFTIKASGVYRR